MTRKDIWLALAAIFCIGLALWLVLYAEFRANCRDPMNLQLAWSAECR